MVKLNVSDLDKELRHKELRPVYFIYGEERHLVRTAISRIRDHVAGLAGDGFEPDRFSAKESHPADMVTCAGTLPMFFRHRLVIISDANSIKDHSPLESYLKSPSKTSTVILTDDKADGRTRLVQLVSSAGALVECRPLYEDKVPDWIRMEAGSRGITMSMAAAGAVAELVGTDLGELSSAIDKIVLYTGRKKTIDIEDVETVLTDTGRKNIFKLAEAVGRRDLKEALRLLNKFSEFNESEVMLLSILARHWRILIKAKEATFTGRYDRNQLPKQLGVNPYFVDGYISQSKLFAPKELKAGFKRLYTADKMLKSSKLPNQAILERCIRELIEK